MLYDNDISLIEFSSHLIDVQGNEDDNIEKLQKCIKRLQDAAVDIQIDINKVIIRKREDEERIERAVKRWRNEDTSK